MSKKTQPITGTFSACTSISPGECCLINCGYDERPSVCQAFCILQGKCQFCANTGADTESGESVKRDFRKKIDRSRHCDHFAREKILYVLVKSITALT